MKVNSKGLSVNFSICPLHRMTYVQPIPHCSPYMPQQLSSYYFNSYNDPVYECNRAAYLPSGHTHSTYGTTHKIKSQRIVYDTSEAKQTSPSISIQTVIKCITNNYCNKAMPHSVKILQPSSSSNSRGLIEKSHGALHHHTCDSGGPASCLFWYDDEISFPTGGRKWI